MAEEELFATRRCEARPTPLRQAATAAYVITAPVQIAEEPPPAGNRCESITLPSSPPRRAPNAAYEFVRNTLALLADTSPLLTIYGPSVAAPECGPLVASPSAYWVPPRASYLEDEPHTQPQRWPDMSPARARSAAEAYFTRSSFMIGDAMPLNRELFPVSTPPPPRSPGESYWRIGTFAVQSEPALLTRSLPDVTPAKARAAPPAYVVASTFAPQSEPPATIGLALVDRARPAGRAAYSSYVVAATFPPAAEPALLTAAFPHRLPAPARTSASAYWRDNRLALDEPIIGVLQLGQPQPGPRRAAFATYFVGTRLFDELLSAEWPQGYVDVTPRAVRRAASVTYWISQLPVTFGSTSGGFPGPFYPEQAEVFVAGPEVSLRFVAGNEAADKRP